MDEVKLVKFRDLVLNSKSRSFCGAKWGNSTVWLNTGETASCHLPPVHKMNLEQVKKDPSKLHNTDHKARMRKQMQEGVRPHECEYCWKIEDMGDKYISDRVYKSLSYTRAEMEEWYKDDHKTLVVPKLLEIMFDRPCNFACSYCNANFSTAWAKDIKINGDYELETNGGYAFKHDGSPNNAWENSTNPYIEAFWEWWPQLSQELRELRVTGGEPLLSKHVWKLIDKCIEENPKFNLVLNTNLYVGDNLIERLIDKSYHFDNFTICTSMETIGVHAEYIRDGLNYNGWKQNMDKILNESNIDRITIMMTINALCLFRITDFLTQVVEWKKEYGEHRVSISINFLRFPAFQSVTVLPKYIRERIYKKLNRWYKKNKEDIGHYSEMEKLLEYIKVIETAHSGALDMEANIRDFKSFYDQYDKRRNLDIEIFPEYFLKWYRDIK